MTKKRYIKNAPEFSLERGDKNQGKKTNLFISSKAKLKRYQARVHGNIPGDAPQIPGATHNDAASSALKIKKPAGADAPAYACDNAPPATESAMERLTPATVSTIAKGGIASPSGSNDIKGVVK